MDIICSKLREEQRHFALVLGEIGLVRSLGEMNIPLLVGSEKRENIALHSRYATQHAIFSPYCSSRFIDELCELGPHFQKKPVLFSDDDRALLNISRNREKLEKYYLFQFPEKEIVNGILCKNSFTNLALTHDLPVPDTLKLSSVSELPSIASRIRFPCIIKPLQRHHWWGEEFVNVMGYYKKAIKCTHYEELKETYSKISRIHPEVVLQEYVEGGDDRHYSANLFLCSEGNLQGYYIARKRRVYPIKAGIGTCIETLENDQLLKTCLTVIERLNLKGLVNIQFKQDSRTGEFKLLEIHIRNSVWSFLGARSGANLGYHYYRYLTEGSLNESPITARPRVKYVNLIQDLRALHDYHAEGALNVADWLKSLQGERTFALLSSKDLMPLLFMMWYHTSRKMRRNQRKQDRREKQLPDPVKAGNRPKKKSSAEGKNTKFASSRHFQLSNILTKIF